jgi:hypothetical protein
MAALRAGLVLADVDRDAAGARGSLLVRAQLLQKLDGAKLLAQGAGLQGSKQDAMPVLGRASKRCA